MQSYWTLLRSRRKFSDRLIAVDHDSYRYEGNGREEDFTVIRTSDWINVIPQTAEGDYVLIRQYRHGIRAVTLEIPGGAIDARDGTPRAAAERELREETGYEAKEWVYLGFVMPNPALQDNRCHTYLALGAGKNAEPRPDPFERIEVLVLPPESMALSLRDGTVNHGLVIAAFGLFFAGGYRLV